MIMVSKRPKYTPDFKREVCEFALHSSINNTAKYYHINRITVTKWVAKYKLQGEEGFRVRKKREITQKAKLDHDTVLKIKKIRDENPKFSLMKIKEELKLDCHISLISRKLSKLETNKFEEEKVHSLNIFINVLSQTVKQGEVYSLYQINVTDNNLNNHFIGFSSFKDNTNLCIFMDYVLSNIQGLDQFKHIKKINTNIEPLNQQGNKVIFNRFIKDKYNIDLEYVSSPKLPKNSKLSYVRSAGIDDLFFETYKKLITDKSTDELHNGIIIPPIFIDDFIQDTNKIISFNNYWNILSLPKHQRNILSKVIEEIEKLGDTAKINFDFENALELYNKIYLTSLNCSDVHEIKINSLVKQADIYYDLDNFELSKKMYNDSLRISNKFKTHKFSAIIYFSLGMISYLLTRTDEADKYFQKALDIFKLIKGKFTIFEFHQTSIIKYINLNNLNNALKATNKLINYAKKHKNNIFLIKGYDILGKINYLCGNYKSAESNYLKQNKIATSINNLMLIVNSLRNSLSLYTTVVKVDKGKIDRTLSDIKRLSKIIKKESYIADANYQYGLYLYNNNKLNEAEIFLRLAASKYKSYKNNYVYFDILYYLGKTLYLLKKYPDSIQLTNELIDVSYSNTNNKYLMYCYNNLGKIYYETNKYDLSINYFNSCINLAMNTKYNFIIASVYKYLGNIYKKLHESGLAFHYYSESLKFFNLFTKDNNSVDISKDIQLIKKELSLE